MSLFKNSVGRPSNETLRNRRIISVLAILSVVVFVIGIVLTVNRKNELNNDINSSEMNASASNSSALEVVNVKKKSSDKVVTTLKNIGGKDKIHFIATQEGDAILLESNGNYGMVDVGSYNDYNTVVNYLKKVGVKKLRFIIFLHSDYGNVGGTAKNNQAQGANSIIKTYKPEAIYFKDTGDAVYDKITANVKTIKGYDPYIVDTNKFGVNYYERISIKACHAKKKTTIDYKDSVDANCGSKNEKIGNGFSWYIWLYNTSVLKHDTNKSVLPSNAQSIVTLISYENNKNSKTKVALYGDMTYPAQVGEISSTRKTSLSKTIGDVSLISVPNRGYSKSWDTAAFNRHNQMLDNLKPEYAVINNKGTDSTVTNFRNILTEKNINISYTSSQNTEYDAVVYRLD